MEMNYFKKEDRKVLLKKIIIITFMLSIFFCITIYGSGDLSNSTLVKGTNKLIQDVTTIITGAAAAVTTLMAVVKAVQWQVADDHEKPAKKKALFSVIIIGVIVATISGVITLILAYYSGT